MTYVGKLDAGKVYGADAGGNIGAVTGGGGGGGDTFLSSSYVTRQLGDFATKEYRLDHVQTSGSYSGSLWTRTMATNESLRLKGTVIGYSVSPQSGSGGIPGARYFRQEYLADVYDDEGTFKFGSFTQSTALKVKNQQSSNLRLLGNDLQLEVTNSAGGIVEWSWDFEMFGAKTTSTSYASSIFDANAITGLYAWFDGSDTAGLFQDAAGTTPVTTTGQKVKFWRDKSANGNNATYTLLYANDSLAPTYNSSDAYLGGQPAIAFQPLIGPSSNSALTVGGAGLTSASYTIFTVHRFYSVAAGTHNILGVSASGGVNGGRITLEGGASGYHRVYNQDGYGGVLANASGHTTPVVETPYILITYRSAGTSGFPNGQRLRVNGFDYPDSPLGNNAGSTAPGVFFLGSFSEDQTFEAMTGNIGEIIIYDRVLDATERSEVENYLKAKYGVSY